MNLEPLLQVAINALAAGLGTGMGIAFGSWLINRHVIGKIDPKKPTPHE